MKENKLIIAAAGAGKTTYLVEEAYRRSEDVLITTFTQENEAEIRQKFVQKYGSVPSHITIQTWFSFLLQHGVKPYQGACRQDLFEKQINGILLVNEQSGVKYRLRDAQRTPVLYNDEAEFDKCFFNKDMRLFTDKLARFVVTANENSKGNVIDRLSRIYPTIFIDEVQDLAGYDLEILRLLFHSHSTVFCVGDPRQVTYYTHWERMNKTYRNGMIKKYVEEKCYKRDRIIIDESTLSLSHRNNQSICDFSSAIYPSLPKVDPCKCSDCHNSMIEHQGVFIVKSGDLDEYLSYYSPVQLRHNIRKETSKGYQSQNFGQSKGKTYNRVVIYPTEDMKQWLKDKRTRLADETRAKLYVAVTRARYSVAFVIPEDECADIDGIEIWRR
jgi:DNA helicase-2/ATP-dependent DNA helicase PcrA